MPKKPTKPKTKAKPKMTLRPFDQNDIDDVLDDLLLARGAIDARAELLRPVLALLKHGSDSRRPNTTPVSIVLGNADCALLLRCLEDGGYELPDAPDPWVQAPNDDAMHASFMPTSEVAKAA